MTKHEAIRIILSDKRRHTTSLNYAIDYCRAGLCLKEPSQDLNVQCLYILNNITHWRHPRAKEVRATLKAE